MKFKVTYSSSMWDDEDEEIEINTLEDLLEFQKVKNDPIILRRDQTLEVYDDYRE